MSPEDDLWGIWTVRVDAAELGSRLEAYNATIAQTATIKNLHQPGSLNFFDRMPTEITDMIIASIRDLQHVKTHPTWSRRLQCCQGCGEFDHLTPMQNNAVSKIDELLTLSHQTQFNGRLEDSLLGQRSELAVDSASAHNDVLSALLRDVQNLASLAETHRFAGEFNVRPIFTLDYDVLNKIAEYEDGYGYGDGSLTADVKAYLTINCEPKNIGPFKICKGGSQYRDGGLRYVIEPVEGPAYLSSEATVPIFTKALHALRLEPIKDTGVESGAQEDSDNDEKSDGDDSENAMNDAGSAADLASENADVVMNTTNQHWVVPRLQVMGRATRKV